MELSNFDVLVPNLPVVFCGINPSTLAAETGHNFGSPSNRFWRVLHQAGFTPTQLPSSEDRYLLQYGCGITAAVPRGTRRASELESSEFKAGDDLLQTKMAYVQPKYLAFLGKSAFAASTGQADPFWGQQSTHYQCARVWILPNPSGLNRSFDLKSLVGAYQALREEAAPYIDQWCRTRTLRREPDPP